ncbi:DUF3265 domain-containing protein [Vibrio vulnificus]
MSLGGKNGLRKLGLCGTHPLTQRYTIGGNGGIWFSKV